MKPSLILLALTAPLAGCVSLLPKAPPPPLIYGLEAEPPAPAKAPATNVKPVVIAVQAPVASRVLQGSDIPWVKDGRFAYIDSVAWAGRAPDLLQSLLILTIDRSGEVRGAVRAGDARADSEIGWDVTSFGVAENDALEARFSAHVDLFTVRGRALLGSLEVDEREPLKDRSSGAAAAALQSAARRGADKIAAWADAQTPEPPADEGLAAIPPRRARRP